MEPLTLFLIILLSLINVVLILWLVRLTNKVNRLTRGSTGASLESVINENNRGIVKLAEIQENHKKHIIDLQNNILNTIQNVGVVRFNPFKDTGGNQSFAIALTNKHKNGIVLSSLYSRERVNVFAKPIENGGSSFQLTNEEQEAINQAHR
jgi:hypothetical protein